MIQSHWGPITKLMCPGLVAMLRSGCAAGWFSMENLPLYTGKPEKTKRGLRSEVQMALLSFLWWKSLKIKQRQQVLTQASFLFHGTGITPFSVSRTEGKLRVVFVLNQHRPWFSLSFNEVGTGVIVIRYPQSWETGELLRSHLHLQSAGHFSMEPTAGTPHLPLPDTSRSLCWNRNQVDPLSVKSQRWHQSIVNFPFSSFLGPSLSSIIWEAMLWSCKTALWTEFADFDGKDCVSTHIALALLACLRAERTQLAAWATYAFGKFRGPERKRGDQRAPHLRLKTASLGLLFFLFQSPLLTGRAFERALPPHPSAPSLSSSSASVTPVIWMASFFWAGISEIQEVTIERLLYACCHHHLSMRAIQSDGSRSLGQPGCSGTQRW